ncbi:MAG: helix-turn-helix transcriptional regulator [Rhodospirillales bacterium]|nr:helix-turn-helix transcriptional regulator [Rhodospirillales bacterium]
MNQSDFEPARSPCPIAVTLDLVGDRWTLILIRDMITGKSRYGEFLESPEGITTNILANRLRRMEETGLVEKTPYQAHPPRYAYSLTERGESLLPVLQEICRWANGTFADTWTPPGSFMKRKV